MLLGGSGLLNTSSFPAHGWKWRQENQDSEVVFSCIRNCGQLRIYETMSQKHTKSWTSEMVQGAKVLAAKSENLFDFYDLHGRKS